MTFDLIGHSMEAETKREESRQRTKSTTHPKSTSFLIEIDSISIDLPSTNAKSDVGKCEHFSIRQYVSDMRKKDKSICWPIISSNGDPNKSDGQTEVLPPLHVPKFRWWGCLNCLQTLGARDDPKEQLQIVPCHCISESKFNTTCMHADKLQLDLPLVTTLHVGEQRNDAIALTDVKHNSCSLPSCHNKEEKKKEVEVNKDHENELEESPNQEIQMLTSTETKDLHTVNSDVAALETKYDEVCEPIQVSHEEASDSRLAVTERRSNADDCSAELLQIGHDQQPEASEGSSKVLSMVDEACRAVPSKLNSPLPMKLDDCDNRSSENDDTVTRNDPESKNQKNHNSTDLQYMETQKMRLLADIMGSGSARIDYIRRAEDNSSEMITKRSAEADNDSVSQGELVAEDDVKGSYKSHKKKRTIPRDENWKPPKMSCSDSLKNKVKIFNTKEGEYSDKGVLTSTNFHCSKFKFDGNLTELKKKRKIRSSMKESSSYMFSKKKSAKEDQGKKGYATKSIASRTRLVEKVDKMLNLGGISPNSKSFSIPQRPDREYGFCKNKEKIFLVKDVRQTSKVDPVVPSDEGIIQNNASTRRELNLSLNSSPHLHIYDGEIPQIQRPDSYLPLQLGLPQQDQSIGREVNIPNSTYAKDEILRRGPHPELNKKRAITQAFLQDAKQQVEDEALNLKLQMNLPGRCNSGKTLEVHEEPEMFKKQCEDEMLDHGTSDDIPMEVVELMAKNQHERRLQDNNNGHCIRGLGCDAIAPGLWRFPEAYGSGRLRFSPEEYQHMLKVKSSNVRNTITTSYTLGPEKQTSTFYPLHMGRNHYSTDQSKETLPSARFGAFSKCTEKLLSGARFSAPGCSRQGFDPNLKWFRDPMENGYHDAHSQTLGSYGNSHQAILGQSKDVNPLWSSMMPCRMPFGTIPKIVAQNSNSEIHPRYPSTSHKGRPYGDPDLRFIDLNASDQEINEKKSGCENFSVSDFRNPFAGRNEGNGRPKSTGSIDLSANEAIPAMHLLSLMDAGVNSSAIDAVRHQKFSEKPPFLPNQCSKDFTMPGYPSLDHYTKRISHEAASVPAVSPVSSTFANGGSTRTISDFKAKDSLKSQAIKKTKSSKKKGKTLHKPESCYGDLYANHESVSVKGSQKGSPKCLENGSSLKQVELESWRKDEGIWHMKSSLNTALDVLDQAEKAELSRKLDRHSLACSQMIEPETTIAKIELAQEENDDKKQPSSYNDNDHDHDSISHANNSPPPPLALPPEQIPPTPQPQPPITSSSPSISSNQKHSHNHIIRGYNMMSTRMMMTTSTHSL
ncbi:hypothetical protein RJ641_005970 [Dillenia turbinata]|uniref:Uncharacterized protein n=1 Tax=Dillenia turbinata TaxID=194707 RepID=A0AAN8V9B9_9MAGN